MVHEAKRPEAHPYHPAGRDSLFSASPAGLLSQLGAWCPWEFRTPDFLRRESAGA